MDLSDGSDVEGDVNLDLDQYEENALLGSDDEESTKAGGHNRYDVYDDEGHMPVEDGDVLELELNEEDGLEFGDDTSDHGAGGRKLAPVQIRTTAGPSHPGHGNQSYRSSTSSVKTEIDDDDEDDDSRNTRSRFLSERNTDSMHTHSSVSSSVGNPIQTLGGGNFHTGGEMRQKQQWGNGRVNPHPQQHSGQRQFPRPQRFPSNRQTLLGEGPRPGNNRFQRPPGPRGNGPPVVQFQGQIFTDFNQPMRPPQPMQMRQEHRPPQSGPQQGPPHGNMQGRRGGPRHMGQQNMINIPPRPNNNQPQFPRPNNNQQQQQRLPHPGMRPQRPANQWRNQRPQQQQQRPQFPGINNQIMQNGMPPPHLPSPPNFPQENRPPPFFDHGMRQEVNAAPFAVQIQAVPPQQPHFGVAGLIRQPLRMQMGPPPQELQPPVQPVQPFFHVQHQQSLQHQQPLQHHQQSVQPYSQEPHQSQGFWPPSTGNANGWMGPQPPQQHPQNFLGHSQNQQNNFGFQPPMEQPQALPPQQPHFIEPQVQQPMQPRPGFDQPMQTPFFDQQRQQYQQYDRQETHIANYDASSQSASQERTVQNRREEYTERSNYGSSHHDHRIPSKRKYHTDERDRGRDRYHGASPEKRLNGRLGPPVKHESPIRDEKAEELMKIREEAKQTMGLDDDYINKLEEQKRVREQILRKKAAARRKVNGPGDDDYDSKSSEDISTASNRPSIYINPKAFKGDLSALNLNLKNIQMGVIKASTNNVRTKGSVTAGAPNVTSSGSTIAESTVGKGNNKVQAKSKLVLRIVRDKHGNEISRSKVKIVPKQQQDGPTSTKTS